MRCPCIGSPLVRRPPDPQVTRVAALLRRNQRKGERVAEYAAAISTLAVQAQVLGQDADSSARLRNFFLRGLRPEFAFHVISSNPGANYREAFQLALEFETYDRLEIDYFRSFASSCKAPSAESSRSESPSGWEPLVHPPPPRLQQLRCLSPSLDLDCAAHAQESSVIHVTVKLPHLAPSPACCQCNHTIPTEKEAGDGKLANSCRSGELEVQGLKEEPRQAWFNRSYEDQVRQHCQWDPFPPSITTTGLQPVPYHPREDKHNGSEL